MDDELDMRHFETLRQRINSRLTERGLSTEQTRYRWLYGALGAVPSDVMFICENPSRDGVKRAERAAQSSGRQPDIEDQWRGGRRPPIKTFRPVLCELDLKLTPPGDRGGWQCYITNVIKEMAQTKTFRGIGLAGKHPKAAEWSDILEWELQQVQPSWVFCVGGNSHSLVTRLRRSGQLPSIRGRHIHKVMHYTAQGKSNEAIRKQMLKDIRGAGFPVGRE